VRARRPQVDEALVDATVQARISRQSILARPKPPLCCFVLSEGVLRQQVGGAEVMAAQLDKLIKAADDVPGFVIQVLPSPRSVQRERLGASTFTNAPGNRPSPTARRTAGRGSSKIPWRYQTSLQ
jgi:hypothetical protein